MKRKDKFFPIEYIYRGKKVGLAIQQEAAAILMAVPSNLKGAPKKLKRLIRIRRNVLREIEALNKELKRHRSEDIFLK